MRWNNPDAEEYDREMILKGQSRWNNLRRGGMAEK
jgi:hypothetical protein